MTILLILIAIVVGLAYLLQPRSTADLLRLAAIRLLATADSMEAARDEYQRGLDKYRIDLVPQRAEVEELSEAA